MIYVSFCPAAAVEALKNGDGRSIQEPWISNSRRRGCHDFVLEWGDRVPPFRRKRERDGRSGIWPSADADFGRCQIGQDQAADGDLRSSSSGCPTSFSPWATSALSSHLPKCQTGRSSSWVPDVDFGGCPIDQDRSADGDLNFHSCEWPDPCSFVLCLCFPHGVPS